MKPDAAGPQLLSAFAPLLQWMRRWLQQQQAALTLPPPSSWEFPLRTSTAFYCKSARSYHDFRAPRRGAMTVAAPAQWCGCGLCQDLRRFLLGHTAKSIDFKRSEQDRHHVEERVQALHNPHLRPETFRATRAPHTLRVVKSEPVFPALQRRLSHLAALRTRLQPSLDAVEAASQAQSAAESSLAVSSKADALASGRGVKREREVGDKDEEGEQVSAVKRERPGLITIE